jgi:hypothetical protein
MKFNSKMDTLTTILIWLVVCFISCNAFVELINCSSSFATKSAASLKGHLVSFAVMAAVATLLIWIVTRTNYIIQNDLLECKSGPFYVKIRIATISKAEQNNSFVKSTIFKPALSRKGYYVYYNKFDSIFISPANEALFLNALIKINPNITFT